MKENLQIWPLSPKTIPYLTTLSFICAKTGHASRRKLILAGWIYNHGPPQAALLSSLPAEKMRSLSEVPVFHLNAVQHGSILPASRTGGAGVPD